MSARRWALADVRGVVYLMAPTGKALVSVRAESARGPAFDEITRLVDAAPELAEACRAVVNRWEHGDLAEAARMCRAALLLAGVKP